VLVGLANHTILLARDGSERPIDDSGAPIRDGDGELMGVVLVFRDVSARRLSEDARERMLRAELQAAAADEANRAKDEFLAIVSHELRSPLHAAVGWLEVLKRGALDETLRSRALHRIGESLRRQATLTNDLLDVSRIVSGKLTIERTAFDLAELLENVVDDKRPRAAEALVRLSLVRTDDAVIVVGDSDRLSQVFSNLLSNAIQFTDGGGVVTVTLDSTPDLAVVTVADTGKGIAPEFLPHVFDRFRQAESGASRSHRGLGLGLAISKHIVERHGGSIVAESAGRGRGATFRVRLSLEESIPGSGAVRAASAPSPALAGLHVLVVMDDPDVPEAMFQRIRAEGATVEQVRGVGAALARCDAEPPDVILADLALPDDDGYTFLREIRLRDKEARRRTTVFAVTTLVENVDRGQAADQGFDGFAVRPVELDRLVADVAAARLRIEASGRA
jgi:signal transduction histidine kinase/CheY-like chemotaxis protein